MESRRKAIERDFVLQLELRVCRQFRISYSEFLGGDRTWTDDDRWLAMGYEQHLSGACHRCGTRDDEWVDPATGRTVAEQPYVAESARCFGCAEVEALLAELQKSGGDLDGVTVRLRRFDPARDDVEADVGG